MRGSTDSAKEDGPAAHSIAADGGGSTELRDARVYSPFCPHWAALQECEANSVFMLAACAHSCATVERLPHSLTEVLAEKAAGTAALSLSTAEVRAVASLAPAMREHLDGILGESPSPAWFAHESGLEELTSGRRYKLSENQRPLVANQRTTTANPAKPAKVEGITPEAMGTINAEQNNVKPSAKPATKRLDAEAAQKAGKAAKDKAPAASSRASKGANTIEAARHKAELHLEVFQKLFASLPSDQQAELRSKHSNKIAEQFQLWTGRVDEDALRSSNVHVEGGSVHFHNPPSSPT